MLGAKDGGAYQACVTLIIIIIRNETLFNLISQLKKIQKIRKVNI